MTNSIPPSEQQEAPRFTSNVLLRGFISLRQRNFRLFWFGQIISLMGSWMQSIGQAWLVLELTHSAWQLGMVGALQLLPVLLFSLFGGVLADRWPRRRLLLVTQSAAMLQTFCLWALIATGNVQLWHLYILALLLGLTSTLDKPARQAFVREMVGREDLQNAIALNSSIVNLTRIVGPSLGGVIIAASSVDILFLINALSFIAVLIGLALIREHELHIPERSIDEPQSIWQSLHEGVSYVWNTPAVLLMILVIGLTLLFGSNFNIFLPLFATDVLHVGSTGFGFLSAAFGIGSLLSALWLAWSTQESTIRRLLISILIFAILEVLFSFSSLYLLSLLLIASIGFAENTFAALGITTLQTIAPDHLRGRIMSIYILFFDGSVPLGYLLVGWLASQYSAPIAQFICALLCLIVVGAGWIWRKAAQRGMA